MTANSAVCLSHILAIEILTRLPPPRVVLHESVRLVRSRPPLLTPLHARGEHTGERFDFRSRVRTLTLTL